MEYRHYLLLGIAVVGITQILWSLYLAYPLELDHQIKKGQAWVYLPLFWVGTKKTAITFFQRVFPPLLMLLVYFAALQWLAKLHITLSVGTGLIGGIAVWWVSSWCMRLRFYQQQSAYFLFFDQLKLQDENSGHNRGNQHYHNLASYQHQNSLRKADEEGKLLKTVGTLAKKFRNKDFTSSEATYSNSDNGSNAELASN